MNTASPLALNTFSGYLRDAAFDLSALMSFLANEPREGSLLSSLLVEAAGLPDERRAADAVKLMLELRPEWKDAVDGFGNTALMTSARLGRLANVDRLLAAGANPKAKNQDKDTALTAAIDYGGSHEIQQAVAKAIIDAASPSSREKSYALARATSAFNLGAVRALLAAGADLSVRVNASADPQVEYDNAMVVACSWSENTWPIVEIVTAMLSSPACRGQVDAGWDNDWFGAAVHCAAFRGNAKTLEALLAAGATIDAVPGHARPTPLMTAALGLQIQAIELLLAAGASANALDHRGRNALHHLTDSSSDGDVNGLDVLLSCCNALLDAGTDPAQRDHDGKTPAQLARAAGRDQLAGLLDASAFGPRLNSVLPMAPSRCRPRV